MPGCLFGCFVCGLPDGFTRQGLSARAVLERVTNCPVIDAAGFNCVSGPNHLLAQARANADLFGKERPAADPAMLECDAQRRLSDHRGRTHLL